MSWGGVAGACDIGAGQLGRQGQTGLGAWGLADGPWIGRGLAGGRRRMPRGEAETGQHGAFN
jgi:hypothetical protein